MLVKTRIAEYSAQPDDAVNGPLARQLRRACHRPRPWLISVSSERTARRSEADDFATEPALQFLREAFEVNQLAVEPVHRSDRDVAATTHTRS